MAEQSLVKFIDEIASGLHPSLPHNKIPLWWRGSNVIFQDEVVQPIPGQRIPFIRPENAAVRGVLEFNSAITAGRQLFWGTPTNLYKWNENIPAVIDTVTRLSGVYVDQSPTLWSLTNYGEHVLAVNGRNGDKPQKWTDTLGDFEDLDSTGSSNLWSNARAEIIRAFGPFIFLYNMDDNNGGAQTAKWCSEDNNEDWIPSGINSAGDIAMRELGGPIIAVEELAGGHGVYAEDTLILVQFVGAPLYFGQSRLMSGIGAISKNSVTTVGRLNFGMGSRGFWRTDGFEFAYIDQPSIHDYIFDNMNKDLVHLVISWSNLSEGYVWWSFPWGNDATENNRIVGFNLNNNTWTINEFGRNGAPKGHSSFSDTITFGMNGTPYQDNLTGIGSAVDSSPLLLEASAAIKIGWGVTGWGDFAWGGEWSGDG